MQSFEIQAALRVRPTLVDAAEDEARGSLDQGTWALFFLDPDTDVGRTSLTAIHQLHRPITQ